jgi:hypothetical protein
VRLLVLSSTVVDGFSDVIRPQSSHRVSPRPSRRDVIKKIKTDVACDTEYHT